MTAFVVKAYEAIRADILGDWKNLLPEIATDADSDNYIRASGFATSVEGLYAYIAWGIKQFFPDEAEPEFMEREANYRGLTRKAATAAAGTITFTGTVAAAVPIGTIAQGISGQQYQTTVAGAIGGGGVSLAAVAVIPGLAGDLAAASPLSLPSPPPGVDGAAVVGTAFTTGTDIESDAQLLARLLQRLRNPPAGGNQFDYYGWLLEVPGVTQAFIYPLRRGVGTVDMAILSNGAAPSGGLLAAAQAHIDSVKPAGLTSGMTPVLAPTFVAQAVTAALTLAGGYSLGGVTPGITVAVQAYFASLTPGQTVVRNRLIELILSEPGVVDVNLTVPGANVATLVDATHLELAQLGVLTLT